MKVDLRLMPYTLDDRDDALAAHERMMANGHPGFLRFIEDAPNWAGWVQIKNEVDLGKNLDLRAGVLATQLRAVVDPHIVGWVSVRFELSEAAFRIGGHIGYYVLHPYRGNGYDTVLLRQSLVIARSRSVGPLFIICDDDKVASAAVAERCGAVIDAVASNDDFDQAIRRYWFH